MALDRTRTRRDVLLGGVGCAVFGALPSPAVAQASWPNKAVRVIVPYAAGGGADTICRLLCGHLQDALGQPFLVDNRGGGGGTIGAGAAAKAAPDGYTVLYDATAFSINPALLPALPYDTTKDFVPVFLAAVAPNLLVANPSVQQATVAEIIAAGKSGNGLDWASAGNGTVQHLSLELFRTQAGIKVNHIPYRGGALALNDLIGGHVKYMFSNTIASSPLVSSGAIKAIAHTGEGQLALFPNLPPVSDTLPGFVTNEWNGVFLPAGTPKPIVDRLSAALNAAIAANAVVERMKQLSVTARANTPAEFASFVAAETERWSGVIRAGNIKSE